MIGNNDIVFNQATMQEIVQYYVDHVLLRDQQSVKVLHFEHIKSGMADTYRVVLHKGVNK